jgi:hypothetical protein
VENFGFAQRKKKEQKERKEGLWKLTPLMEIRKERGFPQRLEALRLHSSAQARRRDHQHESFFNRQRSTLSKPVFGPKNGEHLRGRYRHLWVKTRRPQDLLLH